MVNCEIKQTYDDKHGETHHLLDIDNSGDTSFYIDGKVIASWNAIEVPTGSKSILQQMLNMAYEEGKNNAINKVDSLNFLNITKVISVLQSCEIQHSGAIYLDTAIEKIRNIK